MPHSTAKKKKTKKWGELTSESPFTKNKDAHLRDEQVLDYTGRGEKTQERGGQSCHLLYS